MGVPKHWPPPSIMKRHIPNFITCLNLLSGCVGVTFALAAQPEMAAYCVVVSGVFDFLDGLAARALHVKSPIGKELDSLADVISFGFVPGAIWYTLLKTSLPDTEYLPYLGFIVTVFSAIRLAKFNIDERQSTDFIGLNTPMNAFYVISLPFIAVTYGNIIYHPAFLLGNIAVTSALLVSNIRLFSFKLESLSWQKNRWKFIFIILSAVWVGLLKFAAIPVVLVMYFLFSFIHFKQTA